MSIKIHFCITIECNGCGTDWWEADGSYVVHYDTAAEALEDIAELEWRTEDGHHWCPSCAAKRDCQRNGHLLTSWQVCTCLSRWNFTSGTPVETPRDCAHLWRHCAHCLQAYEKVTITAAGVIA